MRWKVAQAVLSLLLVAVIAALTIASDVTCSWFPTA
jgi:hypothetical protein